VEHREGRRIPVGENRPSCADQQYRRGARKLGRERSAQRACREHLPVAEAAPGVDHQDRKILRKRRILKAVIHHDDARALVLRKPRARHAIPRHDRGCDPREQQRLVADVNSAM
jgi:hypothetical protein